MQKEKKSFKERDGVENPGEGAAGALVFLGMNVTELLTDKRRHREPMSSRGPPLSSFISPFFLFGLKICKWRKDQASVVIKSESDLSFERPFFLTTATHF